MLVSPVGAGSRYCTPSVLFMIDSGRTARGILAYNTRATKMGSYGHVGNMVRVVQPSSICLQREMLRSVDSVRNVWQRPSLFCNTQGACDAAWIYPWRTRNAQVLQQKPGKAKLCLVASIIFRWRGVSSLRTSVTLVPNILALDEYTATY